jgi:uncharacterized membrane protein YeaQ/YmgE (transglycosylase-associated protein family)
MLGLLISLAISGLVIGALARLALPGPDPMGILATIGLGLLAHIVFGTYGSLLFSILGAIVLLYLYRRFVQHRPLTGGSGYGRRRL